MSRAFQQSWLAVLLLVGASRLPAQNDPCTTHTVPVTVVDKHGNPVTGLTATNFRGKFRGKPVEILSVTPDTRPRRIVIVADASATMIEAQNRKWGFVPAVAQQLIRAAPSYTRFALIVFSSKILLKVGFDQDRATLTKALAALPDVPLKLGRVPRQTAFYDALAGAANELNPATPGDAIFVISDAEDNSSRTHGEDVKLTLIKRGVRLFACMPLEELPRRRTPEEVMGPQTMMSLAELTGGNIYSFTYSDVGPGSPKVYAEYGGEIIKTLSAFAQQIGRFDRLEIRLATAVDKPRSWDLDVIGNNGKQMRDVTVLYPHKLVPCNAGQK